MYLPSHFEETRDAVMHAVLRDHPLGLLVTREGDEPFADSIPFLIDAARGPHGTLIAHVARANPLWKRAHDQRVLAVFQGPQAYVSPSAYPSKAEHGKVVPTWNYLTVQVRGRATVTDAVDWLGGQTAALTWALTRPPEVEQLRQAIRQAPLRAWRDHGRDLLEACQDHALGTSSTQQAA